MKARSPGEIITFYSYKGGTGRSMALANVAWILASNGKRVLVLDWDLEAPGLHTYFYPFLVDKELSDSDGIIDFVIDFALEAMTRSEADGEVPKDWYVSHANILRYAAGLDWDFGNDGMIDFVPAGRQGPPYATRVNSFNWEDFYDRLGGGAFLEAAKNKIQDAYDYILIDSRTGVSDTSGICTVQMPSILVVCFTLNNQSIEGAAAVANSVYEQRRESGLQVFPVPTRVENAEKEKLDLRWEYAKHKFAPFPAHMPPEMREDYWSEVAVPYVPYYAYEEILAPFGDRYRRTDSLLASMDKLTAYLTHESLRQVDIKESLREKTLAQYNASAKLGSTDDARSETVAEDRITGQSRAAATETEQGSLASAPVSLGLEKRAPRWAIVAVALALIVIVTATYLVVRLVPVPNLIGQTESAAEQNAGGDFEIVVDGSETNVKPRGTILSQDPQPGEQVQPGSAISVVTSSGLPVPNLIGQTESAAEQNAGGDFEIVVDGSETSTKPRGTILSQDPQPGEQVQKGATISVVTSTGLLIPDLTGQTESAAEQNAGGDFEIVVDGSETSTKPRGTILSQDPQPGEQVQKGTTISVVMSAGEENAMLEAELQGTVKAYYEAVDRQDWEYAYDHLDSQTKQDYTRDEYVRKNEYLHDVDPLEKTVANITSEVSKSVPVEVTVQQLLNSGATASRTTFFVWEDGTWKHRFSPEDDAIFLPDASFEEFKQVR